jgi:hypothetical protein
MKKRLLAMLVIVAGMVGTARPASAVVLTFEGLNDRSSVGNFYNGGTGGNFGITFNNSYAATETAAGGSAPYITEPSRVTSISFYDREYSAWNTGGMNVADGFITELSLFYSSPQVPVTVTIYDDVYGSGNILTSFVLTAALPAYSSFTPVTIPFTGTAYSVTFAGSNSSLPAVYDNISLIPAPEPSTALLFGTGALLIGMYGRQRSVL